MGGGTKKVIVKRQKIEERICNRRAEIVTTAVFPCWLWGWEVQVLSQPITRRRKTQQSRKPMPSFCRSRIYIHCMVLLGLHKVKACIRGATVHCKFIHIREAGTPTQGRAPASQWKVISVKTFPSSSLFLTLLCE